MGSVPEEGSAEPLSAADEAEIGKPDAPAPDQPPRRLRLLVLVAVVVLALDVVTKVTSLRDFFVTLFFVGLNLLPPVALVPPGSTALSNPKELILPVLTLLCASLAAGIRMVRAGMIEVLGADFVQAARLNGVSERRVLWRYGLRNGLAPSVQVLPPAFH